MDNGDLLKLAGKAGREGKLTEEALSNLKRWLEGERFSRFWPEIRGRIEAGDFSSINDAFGAVIPFGTGGRRGLVGVGPNRINERTIGESAQGVANHILKRWEGPKAPGVVIAYDTRNSSLEFATITAEVLVGNGIDVYLFDGPRATPELSFAVRQLGAKAGIVISASHNPPSDNGFKVYGKDGGQIVAPVDAEIIAEVQKVDEIRRTGLDTTRGKKRFQTIGPEIDAAYWDRLAGVPLVSDRAGISIVYTPLHGTGMMSVKPAIDRVGRDRLWVVQAQAAPDGDFPNAPGGIPNPEEPRTLELAISEAKERSADLVLATDPDADRLGVAVRRSLDDGQWVRFTGNQIGALLTYHILDRLKARGEIPKDGLIVKTLVTTSMMSDIAESFGVGVRTDLLVGFKYIAEVIEKDLHGEEDRFIFGAEESHGYLRGTFVRDKDAATASLLMAELTALLREEGKTPYSLLQDLYRRYGYYLEELKSVVLEGERGLRQIHDLMDGFRRKPPAGLGGLAVVRIEDYGEGQILDPRSGRAVEAIARPKGNLLIFRFSEDGRSWLAVRPSGTEPKIKFYLSLHSEVAPEASDRELDEAKRAAQDRAGRVWDSLPLGR